MKHSYRKKILPLLSCLCVFLCTQCVKDDPYYDRPKWLEASLYEVLQEQGFSKYLEVVDRTNYADVLKGAGLYTVFAPTDAAFGEYLTANGYGSVADIPAKEVEQLVAYSLVYGSIPFDSLGLNLQFKYKTNFYALPYQDPEYNNEWVIDQTGTGAVSVSARNYKYLPVYTSRYFNASSDVLTDADYNVFYPNSVFTGKNVQAGSVTDRYDMRASNGVIHEVSKVSLPLDNLDKLLKKPEYSGYKTLLEMKNLTGDFLFKTYTEITDVQSLSTVKKWLPNEQIDRVYARAYPDLAVYPPLENVYDGSQFFPEGSGYTIFVPQNDSLQKYISRRLLKYYTSVNQLPTEAIHTLLNAHMVNGMVWKSTYAATQNGNSDYINGAGRRGANFDNSGIIKSTIASNGMLYQTSNVIRSRLFESVYSEAFLNPEHKWLDIAYTNKFRTSLREDLQKCVLNGYVAARFTMLNFSDQMLQEDGFTYNAVTNVFANTLSDGSLNVGENRLTRLMREHIFPGLVANISDRDVDSEIRDFATEGISNYEGWNFAVTYYGDPVRYRNNQIQAAGNIEDNSIVTLTKVDETYLNGTVWNVDKMLQFSPRYSQTGTAAFNDMTMWKYLDRARTQNPNVSSFVDYIAKCIKPDATLDDLDGIKPEYFYTVLMPNNSAISTAISRGFLPPMDSLDTAKPTYPKHLNKAVKFINCHFLVGRVVVDDGKPYVDPANELEPFKVMIPTLYKVNNEKLGLVNQSTVIEITKNSNNQLSFVAQSVKQGSTVLVAGDKGTTGTMSVQRGKVTGTSIPNNYRSNRIACKAVLHEVNNFFTFTDKE